MATIRSYTTVEQSRKLAEFLPLKSADMDYIPITNLDGEYSVEVNEWDNEHVIEEGWIPCWSLGALFNMIPTAWMASLERCSDGTFLVHLDDMKEHDCYANNPVDACVAMIIKLHEQNLL